MQNILSLDELHHYLESSNKKKGVLVDTSILFSLSYPLDVFNEYAEQAFKILTEFEVPVYTNVNIRSEFIELYRRVTIPEALIDLLEDSNENLNAMVLQKLKSLRTRYRNAQKEGKTFKLSDHEIKKLRELFLKYDDSNGSAWYEFCSSYMTGTIQSAWNEVESEWNLNFLSLRSTEKHPLISEDVSWENMVSLVENYAIGTSDAMILNLFQCSDLDAIITTDTDLVYAVDKLKPYNKILFAPQRQISS